jgi:hypothetical protein
MRTALELFHRLCAVGNALEVVRDATFRQGALWLQLDAVLTQLDAVTDTLAEPATRRRQCQRGGAGGGGRVSEGVREAGSEGVRNEGGKGGHAVIIAACPRIEYGASSGTPSRGIRSTEAHDKKHHDLGMAHTPTYAVHGQTVYVICGWGGCPQRLEVDAAVWRAEDARRREAAVPPAGRMP